MAQKPYVYRKKPTKPSKLVALIALSIAISLPYVLVKTFRPKQENSTNTLSTINLPDKVEPSKLASVPKLTADKESSNTPLANDSDNEDESGLDDSEDGEPESEWHTVTTHSGDTLASVFKHLGLSRKTLQIILNKNPHTKILTSIKTNQQLEFLIKDETLEQLIIPISAAQYLQVSHEGERYITKLESRKTDVKNQFVTATVRGSLYGSAKRASIPYKLITQMTQILKWQVDFSREVRAGDQFTIVYKASFIESNLVGTGEIIAVTYTSKGKSHSAIRHVTANGDVDYYSPEGSSFRKAFVRYPINFSHISSTFSMSRVHPILHYARPHKGVDLAASLGTPIRATGDGRIASIGRDSGYGNMIKIDHDEKYSSIYGHMLKFQKGLSKGDHVKRGQIIGYVGQSGLATGPHCHYEFLVNKHPRNPTTVDIPLATPIKGRELAAFKANAASLLAKMKTYEEAALTVAKKITVKG